jgi:hypothetical protein
MKNKNIIAVKNIIRCLDIDSLKNPEVVANLVRAFGIVQWGTVSFGDDEIFKNPSVEMAGIYQTPIQVAEMLVYLSDFEINSFLEVGVFQGGNLIFMSEYLRRFNPNIRCIGIDPNGHLNDEIRAIIETELFLSFKSITSDHISGTEFDLVFLDGDHGAAWIKKDWENVGKCSKICAIHDIQGPVCPDVVKFWKALKEKNKGKVIAEFLKSSTTEPTKGIGVIHNAKRKDKV